MKLEKDTPGSIGLGFRVPLLVASPWSRGGYVNSQVFDHTSSLQFLEVFLSKKFGKNIEKQILRNGEELFVAILLLFSESIMVKK